MNLTVIVSSFLSGALGAMGLGGGTVLIIYLTSFLSLEQTEAQGINLVFFLVTGAFGIIGNIRKGLVTKKEFKHLMLFALPGLIAGYIILPVISTVLLKKLFGGVLLLIGLKSLFDKDKTA